MATIEEVMASAILDGVEAKRRHSGFYITPICVSSRALVTINIKNAYQSIESFSAIRSHMNSRSSR